MQLPNPQTDVASFVVVECEARVVRQELFIAQLERAGMAETAPLAQAVLEVWRDLLRVSRDRLDEALLLSADSLYSADGSMAQRDKATARQMTMLPVVLPLDDRAPPRAPMPPASE
jgi:hypothetical protein